MSELLQFRTIEQGEEFIVAADTAMGGTDYCSVQFFSRKKLDYPLVWHKKTIATEMTNALLPILEGLAEETGVKPVVAYERNNGGAFELERLAGLNRLHKFKIYEMPVKIGVNSPSNLERATHIKKLGFDTNSATRPMLLSNFKDAIDNKLVTIYHRETIRELFSFVVVQTSSSWKAQAEVGAHDDLLMAAAIAWQIHLDSTVKSEKLKDMNVRRRIVSYTGGDPVTGFGRRPVFQKGRGIDWLE